MSPIDTVLNIHRSVQFSSVTNTYRCKTIVPRITHDLNADIKCRTVKLIVLKLKYVQQRQPVKHKENQSTHESSKNINHHKRYANKLIVITM